MARKSKTEPEKKEANLAASGVAAGNGSRASAPKKKSPPAARSGTKKPSATKSAGGSPKKSSASASSPSVREPSDDEIRLRAYFLAERRIRLSLPGDSAHDWIEARRQLIEEAGRAES